MVILYIKATCLSVYVGSAWKKTLPVPYVTSSSCPWQQKEKKTVPVPCVTSSSCPWQQKENSKQGRAGARARQGRAGQGRAVKNKQ